MKVLILYNPKAGKCNAHIHAGKLKSAILKQSALASVVLYASRSIEEMLKFFATFDKDFDCIAIIGGDGTVGPTIDAMIKNNVDIPVYLYGRGTANDFASFLSTNTSPRRSAQIILANNHSPADTLLVNNKTHAINVACGGAFTNGVTRYNKKGKRFFGKLAYIVQAAISSLGLESQVMQFTVDGQSFELGVYLFYILNSKNVGGLKNSCPVSDINDGLLDLVCIRQCGFFSKISIAIAQVRGKLHLNRNVTHIQGKDFLVEHTTDKVNLNFTLTDIDGNSADPYPLKVTVGPKIKVVHIKQ